MLVVLAFLGLGVAATSHILAADRLEQSQVAAFNAHRAPVVAAPYDPAARRRLVTQTAEIAGSGLLIVIGVVWWRRSPRPVIEERVKWIATPGPPRAAAEPIRLPGRRTRSGSVAAERLSAVVWSDQVVRRQKAAS